LRIYSGVKNGVEHLSINVVLPRARTKPPQYYPFIYNFIPASYDIQKLVELLNYYVFNEPGKPNPTLLFRSSDNQLQNRCDSKFLSI